MQHAPPTKGTFGSAANSVACASQCPFTTLPLPSLVGLAYIAGPVQCARM